VSQETPTRQTSSQDSWAEEEDGAEDGNEGGDGDGDGDDGDGVALASKTSTGKAIKERTRFIVIATSWRWMSRD
jgi:hypothetical protein